MNSDPQDSENSEAEKTYTSPARKSHNKTMIWMVLMFWPPVALIALSLLSALIDIAVLQSSVSQNLGAPSGASTTALAALKSSGPPAWVEPVRALIFLCVVVALICGFLNFVAGMIMLIKSRVAKQLSF